MRVHWRYYTICFDGQFSYYIPKWLHVNILHWEIPEYISLPGERDEKHITAIDRDDPVKAMQILLCRLKDIREPGKWQQFIEALEQKGLFVGVSVNISSFNCRKKTFNIEWFVFNVPFIIHKMCILHDEIIDVICFYFITILKLFEINIQIKYRQRNTKHRPSPRAIARVRKHTHTHTHTHAQPLHQS